MLDYTKFKGSKNIVNNLYLYFSHRYKNILQTYYDFEDIDIINLYKYKYSIIYDTINKKIFLDKYILDSIKNTVKDYFVFILIIKKNKFLHVNLCLYTKNTNELEIFEPYGKCKINVDYMYKNLKKIFESNKINLIIPYDFIPNLSFQSISENKSLIALLSPNSKSKELDIRKNDPDGFCASWIYWYLEMRMNNTYINRNDSILISLDIYNNSDVKIYKLIRSYSMFLYILSEEINNKGIKNIDKNLIYFINY